MSRQDQGAGNLWSAVFARPDLENDLLGGGMCDLRVEHTGNLPSNLQSGGRRSTQCHLDLAGRAQGSRDLFFGSLGHDFAGLNHQQPIAGLADLGKEVTGDEHRVFAAQTPNQVAHLDDLDGVESGGRLVENQQAGAVNQRLRYAHPLAKSVRQGADELAMHVAQGELVLALLHARRGIATGDATQASGESQICAHRHLVVERRHVGQEPDPAAHLVRFGRHLDPVDPHLTRAGQKHATKDLERGGLARAVETDKADNLARPNVEVQRANRRARAEVLGEISYLNHDEGLQVHRAGAWLQQEMGEVIWAGAGRRLRYEAEVLPRHALFEPQKARNHSRENARLWAASLKMLEFPKVRARFALFVVLLAAACTPAGGSPQRDGAVDRLSGTGADVRGSEAGKECVARDPVNLNASSADVLILFDGSDSMGIGFGAGTRYSVLADVLSNLVDSYQRWIRFGFAQFPGADAQCPGQMVTGCCAGPPSVGIAPANGTAVGQAIGNVLPLAGNTPTASALQRAHAYYAGLNDGVADRYVLLATDGLPSCALSGALSASQSAEVDAGGPNACQDAVAQVQALANDGINVLVLAVGAELTDDPEGPPDCLEQMARAGWRPQSLSGQGYYSAASPEALQETVEQIFGGVERTSCSFELKPPPAPDTQVSVYLDGEQIPHNRDDGWDFDSADDMGHISLFGEYCDRIQHFRYSTIEAHFTCKPPPLCTAANICS